MKHLKKIFALAMALFMAIAVVTPAFAATQTVTADPASNDNASITINNPAKGETYNVIKVFDATVQSDGKIAYKGTIPEGLTDYFEKVSSASNYVKKKDSVTNTQVLAALEAWAANQDATATAVSNGGDSLVFAGLPYGYYVMTTTHLDATTAKANVTIDSTNPDAVINDKNETKVVNKGKTVDGTSFTIGQTITYTATFGTTNYYGSGENAGQIGKYVIEDTLPAFLSNVNVTSITIGGNEWTPANADDKQFGADKKITIPWVDENGNSLYENGVDIVVTYTAKLTDVVNVNADNTNTVTITPYDKPGDDGQPYSEPFGSSAKVSTYAAALKKVDPEGNALTGAKFAALGLVVKQTTEGVDGVYTVVSYDATSEEPGTEMSTDSNGMLYIIGLAEGTTLNVAETVAPTGFNKLEGTVSLTPQVLSEEVFAESGTRYYDADGNYLGEDVTSEKSKTVEKNLEDLNEKALKVENNDGVALPSTGGIGTTLFYVIGGLMVAGAAIALVVKNRVAKIEK